MPESTAVSSPKRRAIVLTLQGLVSLAVLSILLLEADFGTLADLLLAVSPAPLLAAIICRFAVTSLRPLRIWILLTVWMRIPLRSIFGIGFLSSLINNLVPSRLGDVLAVFLLCREQKTPLGAATASIAITGLIQALLQLGVLSAVLIFSVGRWQELVGLSDGLSTVKQSAAVTVAALLLVAVFIRLTRRLDSARTDRSPALAALRQVLRDTGRGLSSWRQLGSNTALGLVQIVTSVTSLMLLFPALSVDTTLPVLAAVMFLGLSGLLSGLLPESLGASSAATGVLLLGLFGLSESEALAFAALAWFVRQLPIVVLGALPLWNRIAVVVSTLFGRRVTGTS